jgi:hypothetical protein
VGFKKVIEFRVGWSGFFYLCYCVCQPFELFLGAGYPDEIQGVWKKVRSIIKKKISNLIFFCFFNHFPNTPIPGESKYIAYVVGHFLNGKREWISEKNTQFCRRGMRQFFGLFEFSVFSSWKKLQRLQLENWLYTRINICKNHVFWRSFRPNSQESTYR